ncbi:hypothetical protein AaE_009500 [Aphanomyces astaci]|uniref:DNA replication licensing factor MCM7 n=1 Tax=Aphanomyces astaci TaxID=112090 RepID=A0A6A5AC43_APHAT|nr:hypothetical protein AaE_009500 [Aphanomyces astaci]
MRRFELQCVDHTQLSPQHMSLILYIRLIPGVKTKPVPIRDVKASKVGSLVRIKGMVTRVSNVKPLVVVSTYTCESCSFEVYQEVKSRNFNPLLQCPSEKCTTNRTNGRLLMQTKASKFQKFQEVKFQVLQSFFYPKCGCDFCQIYRLVVLSITLISVTHYFGVTLVEE